MRRLLRGFVLLTVVGLVPAVHAVDVSGWAKRMTIATPGFTNLTTLTNFTIQVKLNTGIAGFSHDQFASPSGYDLRFTDGSTNAWLPYEIEKWSTAGNSYVWVKIPYLKAGTNILAFWGNGAELTRQAYTTNGSAWSGTYIGVWHLNESTGPFMDSTANANHSAEDANTTQSGGPSGLHYARRFYGNTHSPPTTSFIYFAESPSLLQQWANTATDGFQVVTIEAWARPTVTGAGGHSRIMSMEGSYGWTMDQMAFKTWIVQNNFQVTQRESQVSIHDGNFHHLTYALQGNTNWCNIYVDGTLEISDRLHELGGDTNKPFRTHLRKYADFCIGAGKSWDGTSYREIEPFNGDIAEVRISKVVRSADWTAASYRTVASNGTFHTYGPVETLGEGNPSPDPGPSGEPAKNVIILFGDGMSWAAIQAARHYLGRPLAFESFPYTNTLDTFPADYPGAHAYTDSGAAATAIFTGHKVNYYVLGQALPPDDGYSSGQDYTNLCEYMQARGKSVVAITDMYINDATPGGFLAHEPTRTNYSAVADDIFVRARPNIIWGGFGGARPVGWVGDWTDRMMRTQTATDAGYAVVTNRDALLAIPTNDPTLYSCGLFVPPQGPEIEWGGMGYDNAGYDYGGQPHLREMATKAIDIVQHNTNGFVALIEAGVIDATEHWNNISNLVGQMVEFDRTVSNVMSWASGRTDTLVLVCSDHDVGGLTNVINNGVGIIPGGTWQASAHTSIPVPAFAWGQGASALTNAQHLTNLFYVLTGQAVESSTNQPPQTNQLVALTNWTAYNDFQYVINDLTYHISSLGAAGTTNGLVDFATGYTIPATVAFSGANAALTPGTPVLPPGSDADAEFSGKVTLNGSRSWSNGTYTIRFANLDSTRRYSFLLHGAGAANQTNLWADVTISDIDGFLNESSTELGRSSVSISNDTTQLPAANTNGRVVVFSEIASGVDGDIYISITANGSGGAAAYINAFRFGVVSIAEQLPPDAIWSYLDDGSNQGTGWRIGAHPDPWAPGAGPFGYGSAGSAVSNIVNTFISYGPSPTNKHVTSYFRRAVVLDDLALLSNDVAFSTMFDDGLVVYVNGTRVWSNNLPGSVDYQTLALAAKGSGNETNQFTFTVPKSSFVVGTNWIATEVHQAAIDSSDILFSLWADGLMSRGYLPGETPPAPPAEAPWVAFNDLSWDSSQLSYRLTKLTWVDDADHDASGFLVKYGNGAVTPVSASFSGAPSAGLWVTTNIGTPAAGSPGYQLFDGKVDMDRTVFVPSTETGMVTLSGMDPDRLYRVALLGNRHNPGYPERDTVVTLMGADSFLNTSSEGAVLSGAFSETTTIITGTNTGGLLFIYTDIASGSDGDVTLRVSGGPGNPYSWYLNTMMVELLPVSGDGMADGDGDGMADDWEQAYFGGLGNTGALDSDGDGLSDYGEYRAGTSPTSMTSTLDVQNLTTNAPGVLVLQWAGVTGRTYAVQQAFSLTNAWITLQGGIAGVSPLNVYTGAVDSGRKLLRIKVE